MSNKYLEISIKVTLVWIILYNWLNKCIHNWEKIALKKTRRAKEDKIYLCNNFTGKLTWIPDLKFCSLNFFFDFEKCGYWVLVHLYLIRCKICNNFLPFSRLHFRFVDGMLRWIGDFQFYVVPLVYFCFCCAVFSVKFNKSLPRPTSRSLLSMSTSRNFYGVKSCNQVFNLS